MAIPSAMPVVRVLFGLPPSSATILILAGLYWKLHGVHRPETMKKSVIKRRKRVIPATQGTPSIDDGSSTGEPSGSPPPTSEDNLERGSINSDGSVNLGLRRRPEHALSLVPEPILRHNRQASPLPTGGLIQYHQSSNIHKGRELLESFSDDNRLAPLTGVNATDNRQSSLSPSSFLSSSRKRSMSTTNSDASNTREDRDSSKRLSSIKSILNLASGNESLNEQTRRSRLSPGSTAPSPSPGIVTNNSGAAGPSSTFASAQNNARDPSGESEVSKAEKRAALQREAEMMREMLAAKERELAELGLD